MLLIDVGKLDSIEAMSEERLKVCYRAYDDEYTVVRGPIKLKFDKDVLAMVYSDSSANGKPTLKFSVLKSTKRKFKDTYVKGLIRKACLIDDSHRIMKVNNA